MSLTACVRPKVTGFVIMVLCVTGAHAAAPAPAPLTMVDPTGTLQVRVDVGDTITYSVLYKKKPLIGPSAISMTLADGVVLGKGAKLASSNHARMDRPLKALVPVKSVEIPDQYNELRLSFEGDYGLTFRMYPEAVAFQWTLSRQGPVKVMSEQVEFRFIQDHHLYFPEEESLLSHSERTYKYVRLAEIDPNRFCSMPALVDVNDGPKVAITEADLLDYAGMYLRGTSGRGLVGLVPAVATKEVQERDRTVRVTARADYIAQTKGPRSFPWRVLVVAPRDTDLLENQTVFKLASSSKIEDTAWIKPGKVAWDWWNANNLYGVDFRAGVNTETYKAYIDFAARYGLEYIILDEGWYPLGNLLAVSPGMDMEELFRYAKEKHVGIVLWVVWKTLEDQLQPALDLFQKWGAAGIKVDFMQRDDQWMVNYYERVAKEAAKRHLLVDFHGAYKPTGLYRTYPHVVTSEGVLGLEQSKWGDLASPDNAVTFPFMRMLAGPVDYTPGAMINATKADFKPVFNRPMSQGTRCQQLAMYVVFESPLQMLADSPSNYRREPESLAFLSAVPTVWDETKVLSAKVGEHILVARRSGREWYVGAMTNWTPRDLDIDLSFLGSGEFSADTYRDGPNADRAGVDYAREKRTVTAKDVLKIHLAPGGGWVARIILR
jgi:alpha-glucosidase